MFIAVWRLQTYSNRSSTSTQTTIEKNCADITFGCLGNVCMIACQVWFLYFWSVCRTVIHQSFSILKVC